MSKESIKIHAECISSGHFRGQVMMKSEHFRYESAGKNETTKGNLADLLNGQHNPQSVANYDSGDHGSAEKQKDKYELWGNREANGEHLRAFFVKDLKPAPKLLGFVSLDTNELDGTDTSLRADIFFTDDAISGSERDSLGEAIHTVVHDYCNYVKSKGGFADKAAVFYTTGFEPFQSIVQSELFTRFNDIEDMRKFLNVDATHAGFNARFQEGDEGLILENGTPFAAYHLQLSGDVSDIQEF